MGHKKIKNLLENTPSQLSKFRNKINDDGQGIYNTNDQIKFKTKMLKSNLCDWDDKYSLKELQQLQILEQQQPLITNKITLKDCTPFTHCKAKWKITEVDNVKYINVVMPTYYWIVSGDNYLETLRRLWKCQRDELVLTDDCAIDDFTGNNTSGFFNFKEKTAA